VLHRSEWEIHRIGIEIEVEKNVSETSDTKAH
jgi:hypothetical protein